MAGWNNGQVMEPGVYVNEPAPKATKKKGTAQSGALSINMDDLLEALTGQRQGLVSEQPMPKQTAATKEPKETAIKYPGLSGEMGGLASALVGARNRRSERYASTDPWFIGQSVIEDPGLAEGLGMKLNKPWKQGLFNIAQNLIGGYVGGKARQGLAEYDRPFMQAIQGAAQSGDFSKLPISSEDDPTGVLQMSLALSGMDDKKAQREAYNKELIKNGMLMNADGSFGEVPGYAEMRGRIKQAEEGKTGLGMAGALAAITQAESSPYDFGTTAKPYDQKYMEYYDALTQAGMPPGEAAKQASTRFADERKFMGSTMTDAREAREKANKLQGIVTTAEEALKLNPYTGTGAGAWNFITSPFNTKGSAGYGLLNSVGNELAAANRIQGSGAMSDRDLASLMAAGPTADKNLLQNKTLIDKIKKAASNELEFADFVENYAYGTGDVTQARQAWQKYRAENDPFDDKPDAPWKEFFKKKEPAQSSGMDYGLPPGLPPETIAHVPKIFGGAQQLDMETLLDRTKLVESNNGKSLLSPKGAKGAYQFMDETAYNVLRQMGKDPSTYDSNNEAQQREMARFLYNQLLKQYDGNLPLAVAAYNAGTVKVDEALGRGRGRQQQAPAQTASNASAEKPKPLPGESWEAFRKRAGLS